mgnify:CR=1 FL=1
MVLGTTSGAGKSWLATALCRWYARQGLRVAVDSDQPSPFRALQQQLTVACSAKGAIDINAMILNVYGINRLIQEDCFMGES